MRPFNICKLFGYVCELWQYFRILPCNIKTFWYWEMPHGHKYVKCAWADNTYVLKSWIKHWQAWQLQVSTTFSDRKAKTWELYNIIQHCNHESRLGWNIRLKSTTSNHHVHLPQNNNASDFSTDCSQSCGGWTGVQKPSGMSGHGQITFQSLTFGPSILNI